MKFVRLLLCLVAISLLTGQVAQNDLPPRLEINLDRSAMFVALPSEVTNVTQGPDGRAWITERLSKPLTRSAFQTILSQEFHKKMPQIPFARPILFEPTGRGGRVWFIINSLRDDDDEDNYIPTTLIAYDGNTFIESSFENLDHTRPISTAAADGPGGGHAFFCTHNILHIHDGKQWSTREVPIDNSISLLPYRLFTEPDGKGIVGVPRDTSSTLIRWRAGTWTTFALANAEPARHNYIRSAAPRSDGIWLFTANEGLHFLHYQTAATQPTTLTVPQLIEQLKDPNFDMRELATQQLIAKGQAIEPELRKALTANSQNESRYRIEYILANFRRPQFPPPLRTSQFGKYRLQNINYLHPLSNGSTLVAAMAVIDPDAATTLPPPTSRQPALLLQDPSGNVRMLGHPELAASLHFDQYDASTLLFPLPDNHLWFRGSQRVRPSLLDLTDNKIVHSIPLWGGWGGMDILHAATTDGTVFFTAKYQLYAYQPEGKDHRIALQPSHTESATSTAGTLTGDGTYWFAKRSTERNQITIARFDGQKIQIIANIPSMSFYRPILGHNGLIHRNAKNSYSLISSRGSFSAESLEDLIAKHAKEVTLAFVGTRPLSRNEPTHIQADTNGNVWLWNRQPGVQETLKVFIPPDKWLDVPNTRISMLLPLGESPKILAISANDNKMFILSIHDKGEGEGQVKIEPIDETYAGFTYFSHLIYSPQSEPWLLVARSEPGKSYYVARRFTDTGPTQTLDADLYPAATNADGSILTWSGNPRTFKLIRNETITEIPAAAALQFSEKIFFTDPDTLCQSIGLGIQLTPLQNPTNPLIYNLTTPSGPDKIECSPLGFAAVTTTDKPPSPNLYFFPLKKP